MTDLASLVLAVDSSQVKTGTAALDGLTAAGGRAEAATVGLRSGVKGAGAEAAAMAVAAQSAARAAMDQAAGFKVATDAARVNTIAMRETLVVARELSRGNFTRIPGSLTLLAQGIASQGGGISGFVSSLGQMLGLIKTVQNAELAEAAAATAAATAGVEAAARRAAANVMAADTEIALAEAQVRVTAGTSAEGAAQIRLAEAHAAVSAAAAEAAVAEDALAVAMGRSTAAGAASAAETTTAVTGLGVAFGLAAIAGGLLAAAFGEAKDAAEQADPSAKNFIATLGLTRQEIKKLKDDTVTWGDVLHGTFDALAKDAGTSSSAFASFWHEAFLETAQVGVSAAQVILGAFAAAVKGVHTVLSDLADIAKSPFDPSALGRLTNPITDAKNQFDKTFGDVGKFFHEDLPGAINARRDSRLRDQANKLIADRIPKKGRASSAGDDGRNAADDELAKLDAQIASQNALTKAYLDSDSAAIKAEADEKAMTLAVEKHADAAQTAALKSKELALAIATISSAGAKQVADLRFEADSRAAVNNQIEAGIIPANQANEALQLETKLRPLTAALALAEGKAKSDLLDIIRQLTKAYNDNNAEVAKTQALQTIDANNKEIAQLQLKNSLLGHSNEEIATALANLQTMQYLADHPGIDASTAAQLAASNLKKAQLSVQTPFQQWAATIPQTAAAINDALQSIETRGFDNLASSIADVVTGTKSLGQAFKEIAQSIIHDIIEMTIKMLIFRAISSAFGGLGGGGGGFTGDFTSGLFGVPGAATGGSMIIGGNSGVDNNVLSLNGSPVAKVSQGETLAVFPSGRAAANNNGKQVIELRIATEPSDDAWSKVSRISAAQIGHATPVIVKVAATTALKAASRRPITGGRQ